MKRMLLLSFWSRADTADHPLGSMHFTAPKDDHFSWKAAWKGSSNCRQNTRTAEWRLSHKCMPSEEKTNTVIWISASSSQEFFFLKMLEFSNNSLCRRTSTSTTTNAWRASTPRNISTSDHELRNTGLEMAEPPSSAHCDLSHDSTESLTKSESGAAIL